MKNETVDNNIYLFEKEEISKDSILELATIISKNSEWWFPSMLYFVNKKYINTDIFMELIKIDINFVCCAEQNEDWQLLSIYYNINSFDSMLRYNFILSDNVIKLAFPLNMRILKKVQQSKHVFLCLDYINANSFSVESINKCICAIKEYTYTDNIERYIKELIDKIDSIRGIKIKNYYRSKNNQLYELL